MREDITKRIDDLNDELKVRQESIDLLKGRLKNQITSIKETIAKVLDKDTSLGEKIRTLFREQGITILFLSISKYRKDLIHLKLVGLWLWVWFRIILLWLLSFLGSINVITKTTYNSQS